PPVSSPAISVPLASSPMVQRDFPAWLPPMLVKELRQGLRTRGFVGALILFQVVMLFVMLGALVTTSTGASVRTSGVSATAGFFWAMVGVQLLLVGPARALGGLQQEVDSRSIDLLMLTRLSAWRIVLGKWISLLAQALLLLCAMLPYLVVRYFTDNADILRDLGICMAMFGLSAVLTAVGLWASGISKALRILVVVLLVFGVQAMAGAFGIRFFGMRTGASVTSGAFRLFDSPLEIFDAGLIAAFFLISAVRKIAPPAENHGFATRLLPVLAVLPAPFVALLGARDAAMQQLFFGAVFLAFVALFELSSARWTMPAHWREWRRRGPLLRIAGRCALPGWQSALLYTILAGGIWALLVLVTLPSGTVASRQLAERAVSMGLLAMGALVFPLVVRSFIRGAQQASLAALHQVAYWSALAMPVIFWAVAGALAESKWKIVGLRNVMEAVPVSSFLYAVMRQPQTELRVFIAGIVAALTIVIALWQSRTYWRELEAFEARDRGEPPPLPSS
ncbi:MAG: hypothetical protein ABIZ49_11110, partial [Opitutaceae bacterium]